VDILKQGKDNHMFLLKCLFFFFPSLGVSDLVIESKWEQKIPTAETGRFIQSFKGQKVHTEILLDSPKIVQIFDGKKKELWTLDYKKKTAIRMTRRDLMKLKKSIKKMEQALQKLPPQLRGFIGGNGPVPKVPTPIKFKKGSREKIQKWSCRRYTGFTGREKAQELCITDFKSVHLTSQVVKAYKAMEEFIRNLPNMGATPPASTKLPGYPVEAIFYEKGVIRHRLTLLKAQVTNVASSKFRIPKGFKIRSLGDTYK